jgi:hypothetical protein
MLYTLNFLVFEDKGISCCRYILFIVRLKRLPVALAKRRLLKNELEKMQKKKFVA